MYSLNLFLNLISKISLINNNIHAVTMVLDLGVIIVVIIVVIYSCVQCRACLGMLNITMKYVVKMYFDIPARYIKYQHCLNSVTKNSQLL